MINQQKTAKKSPELLENSDKSQILKIMRYPSTTTIGNWQRGRRMHVLCSQLRWLTFNAHSSLETTSGMVIWRPFQPRPLDLFRIEPPAKKIWLLPVTHVPTQRHHKWIITKGKNNINKRMTSWVVIYIILCTNTRSFIVKLDNAQNHYQWTTTLKI